MSASPSLYNRLGRHMRLKALVTPALMTTFFVAYFVVLHNPLSAPWQVPSTALDRWITFHPWALLPYASLWFYIIIPSALMVRRRELRDHVLGAIVLSLIGLLVFIIWPTITPPSGIDWTPYPQMQFLKNLDASGNAFPSLHVAFSVFSAIWFHRMLRRINTGKLIHLLNVLWALAIAYSTIATRQHVVIEALAGALLGWIVARINLRLCPESPES